MPCERFSEDPTRRCVATLCSRHLTELLRVGWYQRSYWSGSSPGLERAGMAGCVPLSMPKQYVYKLQLDSNQPRMDATLQVEWRVYRQPREERRCKLLDQVISDGDVSESEAGMQMPTTLLAPRRSRSYSSRRRADMSEWMSSAYRVSSAIRLATMRSTLLKSRRGVSRYRA